MLRSTLPNCRNIHTSVYNSNTSIEMNNITWYIHRYTHKYAQWCLHNCIYLFVVWFGLVWFVLVYDISTFVDYLLPNSVYTYVLNIEFEKKASCPYTFNGSNSSISNNSISYKSFVCTQFKFQTVLVDQ